MKALRFSKFGSPSVLTIEEILRPEPRAGEALVQVKAAAINPSDVKNVAGHFPATTLPRTPGRDFSGIVVAGTTYQGQEVWSSGPGLDITRDGAQSEYVTVPEEALALKPCTLSLEQVAAIGVPFITAWVALVRAAELQAGETILIIGAASAVGQTTTQIANWRKARVLGAVRSSNPVPGAAAVINTTTDDLRDRVFELTNGKGVDAVLDTVGGAMFEPALRSLRISGRQVAISSTGDRRVSFDLIDFYHNLSRLIGVDSMKFTSRDIAAIADELRLGFEAGALKPPPLQLVPLENAIEAYKRIASGQAKGKQVLAFH
ncbi:MAG TPA: zinc-binding alcohol dehydrogenase family protein [Candidatus Udaeobacter sp.]|nr:zinc-binding alcohol dehydrogenase family protein [Candidatus Udaeobacter sp.]